MKTVKLFMALMAIALVAGCASSMTTKEGAADSKNADGTPKQAAWGGNIIRNIHYLTSPAKNLDLAAKSCMKETLEWNNADASGREKLIEIGREKIRKLASMGYVQYSIGRHEVFHNRYAWLFAPKDMFRIGEEVTLKTVPMARAWGGVTCPNPKISDDVLAIEGIFKCHTGTLLGSSDRGVRCEDSPRKTPYPIFTDDHGHISEQL